MKLTQRLAALEKGLITEPTILTMPDGRTLTIAGPGDYMVRLLGVVFRGATPAQAAQLDLIRRSTQIKEPGGGHMAELVRALLLSPADDDV
jgi:hypothetical protein